MLSPWGKHADNGDVRNYLWWTTKLVHKLGPMGKCYIILMRVCGTITHPPTYTLRHHFTVSERKLLCHTLFHLSVRANKFPAGQRASRCRIQMSCITDLTDVNKQQHSINTVLNNSVWPLKIIGEFYLFIGSVEIRDNQLWMWTFTISMSFWQCSAQAGFSDGFSTIHVATGRI